MKTYGKHEGMEVWLAVNEGKKKRRIMEFDEISHLAVGRHAAYSDCFVKSTTKPIKICLRRTRPISEPGHNDFLVNYYVNGEFIRDSAWLKTRKDERMSCIYGRGDDLWEIPLHFEPLVKSEKGDDELRGTIEITLTAGEYEKAEMRKIESDATAMAVDVQHDIETGNPKTKQKRRGRVIKDLKVQTYLFVRSYEPESAVSYSFIYNYLPVLSLGNEGAMKII